MKQSRDKKEEQQCGRDFFSYPFSSRPMLAFRYIVYFGLFNHF